MLSKILNFILKSQSSEKQALPYELTHQVPVQRADNFIQRISHHPADKMYWLEYILSAG